VEALLFELGFDDLPMRSFPHQLSGGQRQKTAVARALVHSPHVLLLDEPYATLDAHTRRDVERVLSHIHVSTGVTIVYVSHELDSCITLADRVVTIHGNPATVAFDFRVNLSRPRARNIVLGQKYARIRAEILAEEESLYGGH